MMTDSQMARLAEYEKAKQNNTARSRLAELFDDGVFTETGSGITQDGTPSGVVTAYGYINGCPAYAFSQDSDKLNGAVSKAHSAKICRMLELAARNGVPVVGIYDSCGAFMNDGADALNAYSDILLAFGNISGVVPTVSVISGVCTGTMAMIAASADYSVITRKAEFYVSPSTASAPDAAAASGAVSGLADDDRSAMEMARTYLSLMPMNNLSPIPEFEAASPDGCDYSDAHNAALSLADRDSLFELYPQFGTASYTALCTIGGVSAGIAAVNNTDARITADDCAKLSRFVRLCDAYSLPIVTVIDNEGLDNNDPQLIRACAKLSGAYADATCAKISLVTGKAYGSVYIALAGKNVSADAVFALPDAVISPIDPITAAEFLYHDRLKGVTDTAAARADIAAEYAEKEGSAFAAAEKGAVDEIVTAENARAAICSVLEITAGKRLNKRLPKKHSIFAL